jgi:hypothetical protein
VGESGQRVDAAASVKAVTMTDAEPPGREGERQPIASVLSGLFSDNLDDRLEALEILERLGSIAASRLVDLFMRTPPSSGAYPVLMEAVERIGKMSVPALLSALESIGPPRRAESIYRLEALVEMIGHLADRSAVPVLVKTLVVLRDAGPRLGSESMAAIVQAARIRVHRALVELGSRDGAEDLLAMVGDGRRRVREEVIDAAARVGDRRFLPPLARLYVTEMEQGVSEWHARHARWAFREIIRREHVERDDPVLKELDASAQATLEKLMPKSRVNGNGTSRVHVNGNGNGNGSAHGNGHDREIQSA